jgi:hypothetical protein
MKSRFLKLIVIVLILFVSFVFIGCEKEGPAEKAGKKIDEAVEEVADEVDNDGPAEEVGEAIDETVEEAKEEVQ